MHLRAYRLGDEVPFLLLCRNGAGTPTDPDEVPRLSIYAASGSPVQDLRMPVHEDDATLGLFKLDVFLGAEYDAGFYRAVARYYLSASPRTQEYSFEVVAGGDPTGQVISMHPFERPHADFIVQQRTSGQTFKGRSPRL
jgi:hypothetical protein